MGVLPPLRGTLEGLCTQALFSGAMGFLRGWWFQHCEDWLSGIQKNSPFYTLYIP